MTRLNLVLLLVLLASALSLVHQQYEARRLFVALERANAAADRLASEHEQLQVQKRTLAAPARVQQLASERLQMRPIHPGITEVAKSNDTMVCTENTSGVARPASTM